MWWQVFSKEALEFQDKIVARAGLGDETYLPEGVHLRQLGVQAGLLASKCQYSLVTPCGLKNIHLQVIGQSLHASLSC